MATSIGQIGLDLVVNKNQFQSQMRGITNLAKKAGAALAAAFGTKKLIDFSKQCLELGSDLAEVQNVVDVTFPNMSINLQSLQHRASVSLRLWPSSIQVPLAPWQKPSGLPKNRLMTWDPPSQGWPEM